MYSKRNLLLIVCTLIFLLSAAHTAMAQPANDDCSNATPISGNVIDQPFDTTDATYDGDQSTGQGNIWFCYTAECTGRVHFGINTGGTGLGLYVYDGCTCYPTVDDIVTLYGLGGMDFDAIPGHQYLIEIQGLNDESVQGTMSMTCEGTPANDDCSNATPVGNVTDLAFDTTTATHDGSSDVGQNIWYCYTAECTGAVTISLSADYSSLIYLYDGCGCPAEWDDIITLAGTGLTFNAIMGNQYLIEVGGNDGASGTGTMTITCYPAPANDDCNNATPVGNVTDLAFDTMAATHDGTSSHGQNIWYCYTATCTGKVQIYINTNYSSRVQLYDGCSCSPTGDSLGWGAIGVEKPVIAGNQYLIEVGGQSETDFGTGTMTITCNPYPANDDCGNATPVGNVIDMPFDTTEATPDGAVPLGRNIWYCYTADCTGLVYVTLLADYDTMMRVYDGCGCPAEEADIIAGAVYSLTFAAVEGNQYMIEVGGQSEAYYGTGLMSINCEGETAAPANDNCANATPVGNVTNLAFNTTNATPDGTSPLGPNIWYCYTADCTGKVYLGLKGNYETMVRLYNGCGCPAESGDIIATDAYSFEFDAIEGNQYLIEVGGNSETSYGQGVMIINCYPYPANDDCSNATPVGNVTGLAFETTYATSDGTSPLGPNIWYCYTADCTGKVYLGLKGNYETMVRLYDGCGCPADWDDIITTAAYGFEFDAVEGHQYLIEVGGNSDTSYGQGVMVINCYPQPANDDCSNAESIGDVTDLPFDTTAATPDGTSPLVPNIWYCYTATCTGKVSVSLNGNYDTMVRLYDGCGCPAEEADIITTAAYGFEFDAVEGNQYLIEVGGDGDARGQGLMSITCEESVQQSVDHLVSVSTDRVSYDRRTQEISVDVTVVNISSTAIGNPLWLVIESIGGTNVTLSGSSGTTGDGYPYIDLSGLLGDGQLDPGESVSVRVYFDNPGRSTFSFTPGVRGVI